MVTKDLHVVVVDDDQGFTAVLEAMLKQAGATVVRTAQTYEEGLGLVDGRERCDLGFLDLHLSGEAAGVDLAQRAVRAGLSVIVMTGSAALPDELSGVGLLMKPFSTAQLRRLLHALKPSVLPSTHICRLSGASEALPS